MATEPLGKALNAYVMQDEARHVMFGRLALRDYYPQLTQAERDEREEFCVDACYRMRDRFLGEEVWEALGPARRGRRLRRAPASCSGPFRGYLFMRIVPILKDIGLWGPGSQKAFADMGVLEFADSDIDAAMAERRSGRRRARQRAHGPHQGRGRRGLSAGPRAGLRAAALGVLRRRNEGADDRHLAVGLTAAPEAAGDLGDRDAEVERAGVGVAAGSLVSGFRDRSFHTSGHR